MKNAYLAGILLLQGSAVMAATMPAPMAPAPGHPLILAQEGDGTRVDDRVERRQERRATATENYEGDGTRVDDRVERRQERRATAMENHEGDGTRVDDRVERRQERRAVRTGD